MNLAVLVLLFAIVCNNILYCFAWAPRPTSRKTTTRRTTTKRTTTRPTTTTPPTSTQELNFTQEPETARPPAAKPKCYLCDNGLEANPACIAAKTADDVNIHSSYECKDVNDFIVYYRIATSEYSRRIGTRGRGPGRKPRPKPTSRGRGRQNQQRITTTIATTNSPLPSLNDTGLTNNITSNMTSNMTIEEIITTTPIPDDRLDFCVSMYITPPETGPSRIKEPMIFRDCIKAIEEDVESSFKEHLEFEVHVNRGGEVFSDCYNQDHQDPYDATLTYELCICNDGDNCNSKSAGVSFRKIRANDACTLALVLVLSQINLMFFSPFAFAQSRFTIPKGKG